MKLIIKGVFLLAIIIMLVACGDNNDDDQTFDDLNMSLLDTTGNEVELFNPSSDKKELYLYFTGVS